MYRLLGRVLNPVVELQAEDTLRLSDAADTVTQLVELSSQYLLLPALFPALQQKFPQLLENDTELRDFLEAAFDLNSERYKALKMQAESLSNTLRAIPHLFIKGATYLFDPPPYEWRGRMTADIDLLVSEQLLYQAAEALIAAGYKDLSGVWYYDHRRTQHYAPLAHESEIAMVEIHEHAISRLWRSDLQFESLSSEASRRSGEHEFGVPSASFRVAQNVLHAQLGEGGFFTSRVPMRELFDFCLLSTLPGIEWQDVFSYFPSARQREMLASYLAAAEHYYSWTRPADCPQLSSKTFFLLEKAQRSTAIRHAYEVSFGLYGAFSSERIHSRFGYTESGLQMCGHRAAQLLHLMSSALNRASLARMRSSVREGSVQIAATEDSSTEKKFELLPLDSFSLLVDRESGASFLLNASAALIAEDLLGGISVASLADIISQEAGIPYAQAFADVESVRELLARRYQIVEQLGFQTLSPEVDAEILSQSSRAREQILRLGQDIACRLRYSPHLERTIHHCLSKLSSPEDSTAESETDQASVLVIEHAETLFIRGEDGATSITDTELRIPTLLFTQLQRLIVERCEHPIALHGGAYRDEDGGVTLVLGKAGAGKSSFLYDRMQIGAEIVADDLLLFNKSLDAVLPLPFPIALKEGSWNIFSLDPAKEEQFIHPSGRRIAFFKSNYASNIPQEPLSRILFPLYRSDTEARIEQLDRSETLQAIAESGFVFSAGDYVETMNQLLRMLLLIPAYRLEYSSLEQARNLLAKSSSAARAERSAL